MNWLFDLLHNLAEIPWISQAFHSNRYLWLHITCGGLFGFFARKLDFGHGREWRRTMGVLLALGVAMLWELVEIYAETPSQVEMVEVYGSVSRYHWDTGGDIVAFVIAFFLAFV